jgi:hypothetical protein
MPICNPTLLSTYLPDIVRTIATLHVTHTQTAWSYLTNGPNNAVASKIKQQMYHQAHAPKARCYQSPYSEGTD